MADEHADLPAHIADLDGPEARRQLALAERQLKFWQSVAAIPIHQQILDKTRARLGRLGYQLIAWAESRRGRS